ncbi:hypothetical protein IFO69_16700 [Echinicola sp. CAU 1574]|uniref:DUF6265 domain-containing protein n=1 Tax=Echinicola arenosa TaxID=2774144 RepID=A0ABR9ANN5_9BACT|nr:DUF6265 family protein [Echinicola arenosa]MBD8490394.1 hypothetical protein [Echinicola arenosa]
MKKIFLFLVACFVTINLTLGQEVLKLKEGEKAAPGNLSDLNWMVGFWKGNGFGGECEELWLPQQGNSMVGIFRFIENGKLVFSEYMAILEEEGKLQLKVKHFGANFTGWEEKEEWVNFRFIKTEEQTAYFSGLTIRREGEKMILKLAMEHNGESSIETFEYIKENL